MAFGSGHSSRSGTANGAGSTLSSHQSPVSMQGSPGLGVPQLSPVEEGNKRYSTT